MAMSNLVWIRSLKSDIEANILLRKEGSRFVVKMADLGNSIRLIEVPYYTDFQIQSLFYRAPEVTTLTGLADLQVFLGSSFGTEIDMWSLGCVICQMFTIHPIFHSSSVSHTFIRMISILGPLPGEMLSGAQLAQEHFDNEEDLRGLEQFLQRDYFLSGLSETCPNKEECLEIMSRFVPSTLIQSH